MPNPTNPLIVQSDKTILLDVHAPLAEECRNALIPFAELERSPEHLHTYRLTPLSLWNVASAGIPVDHVIQVLEQYSRYPVPQPVSFWITEIAGRFGKLRMIASDEADGSEDFEMLYLETDSVAVYKEIEASKKMKDLLFPKPAKGVFRFALKLVDRGTVKQELLTLGWPVKDEVPLVDGEPLELELKPVCSNGRPFVVRDYQKQAARALVGDMGPGTGFGTIVLPCGAGKTIVGMEIMSLLKTSTLIVTTNISAVHQWIEELLDKTSLKKDQIAEYTGEEKEIKQVTIATYQILTWRPNPDSPYPHFGLFRKRPWGLIIYDEVHLLPAPVFRVTAELQAVRRVGLTATLVREDNCEGHVFSLVGPKRYDVPWKELENSGWIAEAECVEVRLDLPQDKQIEYAVSGTREKHKIASNNGQKIGIVELLIKKFSEERILVIGQYLEQLNVIAEKLKAPIITGKTPNTERDRIYNDFRAGKIRVLVVSKVANFAIDLPDASMAIQISGTFGSRQEEAQRLGRLLRPKNHKALFFTLITRNTVEEEFGTHRQKFLAEQGYDYKILRYVDDSQFTEQLIKEDICNG